MLKFFSYKYTITMKITDFSQDAKGIPVATTQEEGFLVEEYVHKTSFSIKNISVALANTLRRSFSTLCPTITFDKESINIIKNTTSLHNEFIIHRLELVPIYSDNDQTRKCFQLKTFYDQDLSERRWEFSNITQVPKFTINTALPTTTLTDNISMNNIKNITTDSFTISLSDTVLHTGNFFKKDIDTNDPILINCIKVDSKKHVDALHFEATPVPGIGKVNTRNDPTGTVEYQFKLQEQHKIDEIWKKKLTYLEKERKLNQLVAYTDKEIKNLKSSFDLLDKYRIYQTDDNGKANHFKFSVESIGFMSSSRIIYDSVKHLELCIDDLINNLTFKKYTSDSNFYILKKNTSKNIEIRKFKHTNINEGCSITIKNENHTLGNLIQDKLRTKYLIDRHNPRDASKYLKLANYRMNHPTIEEIEIMLSPKDNISKDTMKELINIHIKETYSSDGEIKIDNNNKILYFSIYLFIETLKSIKIDISTFLTLYSDKSGIRNPSYTIE